MGRPGLSLTVMQVATPTPSALLEQLVARVRGSGLTNSAPLAMLDPTWPAGLQSAAREQLAAAALDGRLRPDDLVLFTSGSAGEPQGVVRTLQSWRASLEPLSDVSGIGSDDVVWLPLPLTSTLSLYGALHARAVGAKIVLGSPSEPLPMRASATHVVPTLLVALCQQAEDHPAQTAALRTVVVAGAALDAGLRARAQAQGWAVLEYYGAAELSFVGWRRVSGPFLDFPGAQVQVRDDVLWVRSPYLSRGYLSERPGAALRRDGAWASVGDRGQAVGDGWVVLGRGDAAVTTGGHTVVVEEVEAALAKHPGVLDVAVLGSPHPRLGQVVTAVVVVRPGVRRAHLDQSVRSLPPDARPRRWLRAEQLPRTVTGKLVRAQLAMLAPSLPRLP